MAIGTNNFRTSTITRHIESDEHQRIITTPEQSKAMEVALKQAQSKEEKALMIAMKAVFWIAKENLPMNKYNSLMALLIHLKVPDIENLKWGKTVDYCSTKSGYGFLDVMSSLIDENITNKMKESPVVTILTDESTDIVVHHKLTVNIRLVHPVSLSPSTYFLADVHLDEGTGAGIFKALDTELTKRGVPMRKVLGLGTDGATVMTGKKNGLTGRFLRENPHIANTHCGAHKVALVSEQAAAKVKALQDFKETITSIYYYFKQSAVRVADMAAIQKVLDDPVLQYKEVHQVRWLSFYTALDTVVRTLDSLISYFATKGQTDAKAKGLSKKIGQELFIKFAHGMLDWLQPIMRLSLFFQKKDLEISEVKVNIDMCVKELEELRDEQNDLEKPHFIDLLNKDLQGGFYKGHKVDKNASHFNTVQKNFLQAMIDNLQERFPESDFLIKFGVLGMRTINFLSDEDLNKYGEDDIKSLAEFYTSEQTHTADGQIYRSAPIIDCSAIDILQQWRRLL